MFAFDWVELQHAVSDAWLAFGHLQPLYILLTIAGAALTSYVFSRAKETLVLALTAAVYAIPFLLT